MTRPPHKEARATIGDRPSSIVDAPRELLMVFTRYPAPGQVKTRLARTVGPEAAARFARAALVALLARLPRRPGRELEAHVWPPGDAPALSPMLPPDVALKTQSGTDLGERMARAFEEALQRGYGRVAVVGSDSPDLPPSLVDSAFEALESSPVALGPSSDGGYCILSSRCPPAALFHGVSWGTGAVHRQTLDRARLAGLEVHILPAWHDVDEIEDLRALAVRLQEVSSPELEPLRQVCQDVLRTSCGAKP